MFRETKDGVWHLRSHGMRRVEKNVRDFYDTLSEKDQPALCGGAGTAVGLWQREIYRRGRGVLTANDRARACRARCVAS